MYDYNGYVRLEQKSKSDQVVYCTGSDDVDGFYIELKDKGISLMGEPQNVPDWEMRCFYFRGPEDNLFEVSGSMR